MSEREKPHWVTIVDDYERDKFGLPIRPATFESDGQRLLYEATLEREAQLVLAGIFAQLKSDMGLERARLRFDDFKTPNVARAGRPRLPPATAAELLRKHDWAAAHGADRKSLVRTIGEQAHAESPGRFGVTPTAIEATLRRLLRKRESRKRDEENTRKKILRLKGKLARTYKNPPD